MSEVTSISGPTLKCEKLVYRRERGHRGFHEACGRPAMTYQVSGESYSCRAVFCDKHRELAKAEGFKLKALP